MGASTPKKEVERVKWQEVRGEGENPFFVIAERVDGEWKFSERESWDISWYPLDPTPERIQKAEDCLE